MFHKSFTHLGTFKNFFTWQRQWREASLIAGDNPIMGLHSLNSTLYSHYIVIVLKRKKKIWKNVSVGSQDPLCMIWKLITPRKYSFRFQSSHNLHLPHYLTSNFHSPVSLLNVVSLRSIQPEEGWDKTCPWLSQMVLLKLQGSRPDLL